MKIGPVDIRNHSFARRAMRGLDEAEVRAYLDLVADSLQEAILENEEMKNQLDRLDARIGEYGNLERTLRDSLVAGEKVADERLRQAEREAQIVIKGAEVEAEKIVGGARQEVARLRAAIDDLRRQRITYAERFRALLRSQFKILEASLESYDPDGSDVDRVLDEIDRSLSSTHEPVSPFHRASSPAHPAGASDSGEMPRPPVNSYLGEEGLFTAAGSEDESRSEEG
ncbi:MAG: DivIVA domain-containing protein [bacterium]